MERTGSEDTEATLPVSARARRRFQSAQDIRNRRRRVVTWGLSIALCVLFINAIVGENGYLAALRVEHEQAELAATVARLRMENHQLQLDRERLASDPSALEETARRQLGLLRPGETLVIVRDATNRPSAAVSR